VDAKIIAPASLADVFTDGSGNYRLMTATLLSQLEFKAQGVKQSGFRDFLVSNKVDMQRTLKTNRAPGVDELIPFLTAHRDNYPINNEWWNMSGGVPCSADGTQPGDSTHWRMDFTSPTGIPLSIAWFNPQEYVFVKGVHASGDALDVQYKVISRTDETTAIRVVALPVNTGSFAPAANRTNPTTGYAVRGVANVDKFKSFCAQAPAVINDTYDDFAWQDTRSTMQTDELVEQFIDMIRQDNPLYAKMFDIPNAKYNAQLGEGWNRMWANNLMYSKPLANQRRATLASMETITTTEPTGNRTIGYRANNVGWKEQMWQCNRVADLQGVRLNIASLGKTLYKMGRIREFAGHPDPWSFEAFVPRTMIPGFRNAMVKYWKARGVDSITWEWKDNMKDENAPFKFKWVTFELDEPTCTIKLMTDPYFDDELIQAQAAATALNNAALVNRGRQMVIIDWSKTYTGILGSKRYVRETGGEAGIAAMANTEASANYACVAEMPKRKYVMTQTRFASIMENPQSNIIIDNIGAEAPDEVNDGDEYGGSTTFPS
jgi:hypothetical protein